MSRREESYKRFDLRSNAGQWSAPFVLDGRYFRVYASNPVEVECFGATREFREVAPTAFYPIDGTLRFRGIGQKDVQVSVYVSSRYYDRALKLEIIPRNPLAHIFAEGDVVVEAGGRAGNVQTVADPPLITAAEQNNVDALQQILGSGADVNTATDTGLTALMSAASHGHTNIVRVLLNAGAEVNLRDKAKGGSALWFAAADGYAEVAELLLAAGADASVSPDEGMTPLLLAAQQGHTDTVKVLLRHNVDINQRNAFGSTALIAATAKRHMDIVKVLLEAGADSTLRTGDGLTALETAQRDQNAEAIELFESSSRQDNKPPKEPLVDR